MRIVSACLLGINCRYNGGNCENKKILELAKKETLIPVCPEQLGGLTIPRAPSEKKGNKVITKEGKDVSAEFKKGAEETLKIAKLHKIKEAIMKQKSPSCGSGKLYDGSFSGKTTEGDGITTALLKKNGMIIKTEEDF